MAIDYGAAVAAGAGGTAIFACGYLATKYLPTVSKYVAYGAGIISAIFILGHVADKYNPHTYYGDLIPSDNKVISTVQKAGELTSGLRDVLKEGFDVFVETVEESEPGKFVRRKLGDIADSKAVTRVESCINELGKKLFGENQR